MSGAALESLFTTTEELNEFVDRDSTANMIGYVDSITAPATAGKAKDLLFKFTLSNGKKRVTILMWGENMIKKHCHNISSNRIISISGGLCRAISETKYLTNQNLIPFEIIIKENTKLDYIGFYEVNKENHAQEIVKEVTFDTIHNATGLIEINGFIRNKFDAVRNRNGVMIYGLGAITDGHKKITVQIQQFEESSLELGDAVVVRGTVKEEGSLITIHCMHMNCIKLDAEKQPLVDATLLHGNRPIKRCRTH